MNHIIEALEKDLADLVYRHSLVSGREFQRACLTVAAGYYDAGDLDCYCPPSELAAALARELERLSVAD